MSTSTPEESFLFYDDGNLQKLIAEKDDLDRKLGAAEYEVSQLYKEIRGLKNSNKELLAEKEKMKEKFKGFSKEKNDLSGKLKKAMAVIGGMKAYMKELPLKEEYETAKKLLEETLEEAEGLKEKVRDREEQLQEANADIRALKEELEVRKVDCEEMGSKLKDIEERKKAAAELNQEEVEDVIWERNRLQMDLHSANELIKNLRKNIASLEDEEKSMKTKLTDSSREVQRLKNHSTQLQGRIEIYQSENQKIQKQLVEETQLKERYQARGDEHMKSGQRLAKEMQETMCEMKRLISFCEDVLSHGDSNLSLLLGTTHISSEDVPLPQEQLMQLRQLRSQMRTFQDHLSNQCAQKVGENLAEDCKMQ